MIVPGGVSREDSAVELVDRTPAAKKVVEVQSTSKGNTSYKRVAGYAQHNQENGTVTARQKRISTPLNAISQARSEPPQHLSSEHQQEVQATPPDGSLPVSALHLTAHLSFMYLPATFPRCDAITVRPMSVHQQQRPIATPSSPSIPIRKRAQDSEADNFVAVEGFCVRTVKDPSPPQQVLEQAQAYPASESHTPAAKSGSSSSVPSSTPETTSRAQHSSRAAPKHRYHPSRTMKMPEFAPSFSNGRVLSGTFSTRDGVKLIQVPASTTRRVSFTTATAERFDSDFESDTDESEGDMHDNRTPNTVTSFDSRSVHDGRRNEADKMKGVSPAKMDDQNTAEAQLFGLSIQPCKSLPSEEPVPMPDKHYSLSKDLDFPLRQDTPRSTDERSETRSYLDSRAGQQPPDTRENQSESALQMTSSDISGQAISRKNSFSRAGLTLNNATLEFPETSAVAKSVESLDITRVEGSPLNPEASTPRRRRKKIAPRTSTNVAKARSDHLSSMLMDSDMMIDGDLDGWGEGATDVFSAFHQAQAHKTTRTRKDDLYRQRLHTPGKLTNDGDDPGAVSGMDPMAGNNTQSSSTGAVSSSGAAASLNPEGETSHPLARHGYTVTPTWKNKKERKSTDEHASDTVPPNSLAGMASAVLGNNVGPDLQRNPRKGARRKAVPNSYKDGYLFDVNLPLRLNFVQPQFMPDGTEKEDDGIPSDDDSGTTSSFDEIPRHVAADPYSESLRGAQNYHGGSKHMLGAYSNGYIDLAVDGEQAPLLESHAKTYRASSQDSNDGEYCTQSALAAEPSIPNQPGVVYAPNAASEELTAQWRHQRNVAAMTMKELKKIFPPLMKRYGKSGSTRFVGMPAGRGSGAGHRATGDSKKSGGAKAPSGQKDWELNFARRLVAKSRSAQGFDELPELHKQQSMWKRMDAEFRMDPGQVIYNNSISHRLPELSANLTTSSYYDNYKRPYTRSSRSLANLIPSSDRLELPTGLTLPLLVQEAGGAYTYGSRLKRTPNPHPARKQSLHSKIKASSEPNMSLSLSSSLSLMQRNAGVDGSSTSFNATTLAFPSLV
ncbi:hypothetical protein DFS34DRAFT_683017 [Phlyctochytrium arcticum]|nr:hypothetical protein DFS34DRAFT_683017 [Phlyctochytrium arcticum]